MKNTGPIPFAAPPGMEIRTPKPGHDIDPIGEFGTEAPAGAEPAPQDAVASTWWSANVGHRPHWVVAVLAVLALVQVPIVLLWALQLRGELAASTGTVVIDTEPTGIEVMVEGKVLGTAPLEMPLAPGQRRIELRQGNVVRSVSVVVTAGETVRHRFEFISTPQTVVADPTTGILQVTTQPARVTVVVDGTARGVSPLSIADLTPGEHRLSVRFPAGAVERQVQVQAGATSSIQIEMPSMQGALSGWVDVEVPVSLRISEGGRFIGTTDIDRLMLPVGEHVLDIDSDELGFRTQRTVRVTAGATTTVQLELPRASLSINARPWAEAWVDGERVGETPIGNLSRTIGRHEVVLRHPELGERRESVLVTLNQPARVSVDLRQR